MLDVDGNNFVAVVTTTKDDCRGHGDGGSFKNAQFSMDVRVATEGKRGNAHAPALARARALTDALQPD